MSTVDPARRWFRNARTLRSIAIALWVFVFLLGVCLGWTGALYLAGAEWTTIGADQYLTGVHGVPSLAVWVVEVLMLPYVFIVMGAGWVDGYARHQDRGGEAWAATQAFGWSLLGLGLGGLVTVVIDGTPLLLPVVLTSIGALLLGIKPITTLLMASNAKDQSWSRMNGTPVTATVTAVDMETINSVDRWKATLTFEDQQGRSRWHKASIPLHVGKKPGIGQTFELRFDPEHPGRRSTIFVDLSRESRTGFRMRGTRPGP